MVEEPTYVKIVKLRQEIKKLFEEIRKLEPKAVEELRLEGVSYDNISKLLNIGKVNAIRFAKMSGEKRGRGR